MRPGTTGLAIGMAGSALAALAFTAVLALAEPASAQRCSGCGCKGGPGYRGPNGQCVGWRDLDRICGKPPTLRCKPEIVNPRPPSRPKRPS
jgi:hypothetical protein